MTDERKAVKYHDRLRDLLLQAICMCNHKTFKRPCSWCLRRDDLLREMKEPQV